jgi:hypothetical protein
MRRIVVLLSLVILNIAAVVQAGVVTFQETVNGYAGTQDAYVNANEGNLGGESTVSVDASDGGAVSQGLLRFDGIIGNGPGQIPTGSTINSAKIRVVIDSVGSGWLWHRMLKDWDENTVTWNSLVNGIQADDVDAVATATFQAGANNGGSNVVGDPVDNSYLIDITADVQAWANGASNYGWGILPFTPSGTNGIDFFTKEWTGDADNPIPASFPLLTVDFTPVPEPHSVALLLTGMVLAGGMLRRKRK